MFDSLSNHNGSGDLDEQSLTSLLVQQQQQASAVSTPSQYQHHVLPTSNSNNNTTPIQLVSIPPSHHDDFVHNNNQRYTPATSIDTSPLHQPLNTHPFIAQQACSTSSSSSSSSSEFFNTSSQYPHYDHINNTQIPSYNGGGGGVVINSSSSDAGDYNSSSPLSFNDSIGATVSQLGASVDNFSNNNNNNSNIYTTASTVPATTSPSSPSPSPSPSLSSSSSLLLNNRQLYDQPSTTTTSAIPLLEQPNVFQPAPPQHTTNKVSAILGSFASYTPSVALSQSQYVFQCTPTYYAAKKNQKIGIFLYHKNDLNFLHTQHPQLRLKLTSVAPYWTPSSFTRKDNKKNIDTIAPTQFEPIDAIMKKGEVLFGPVRIQKTGFYFLKCSVELPPFPSEDELPFKDFSFSFKVYFYGSPSKKKGSGGSSSSSSTSASSSSSSTSSTNDQNNDSDSGEDGGNETSTISKSSTSKEKPTSISNINIRPNENLMNYISHLQETGARWRDLENVFDIYIKKYEKTPEILSDLFFEQGIASTFVGNLHEAQLQMDKGLETFYTPENLFKISYLKSVIFRIQRNFTASKLHLDTCDFLYKKIDLDNLHQAQYYFNKAAHDYDCFVGQKTKQNNYVMVRDQIIEKFKQAADFYKKDYESSDPNSTTNARSINGTYRANIRITQTILGSSNLTDADLTRAESYLAKIPNIQSYTFTQRTQVHLLFTWADLMLSKSYQLFRSNHQQSFHMLAQSLEYINKSANYASKLGFNNEIRYTNDRYQKLFSVAPKSFINALTGANLLGNNSMISTPPLPTIPAPTPASTPVQSPSLPPQSPTVITTSSPSHTPLNLSNNNIMINNNINNAIMNRSGRVGGLNLIGNGIGNITPLDMNNIDHQQQMYNNNGINNNKMMMNISSNGNNNNNNAMNNLVGLLTGAIPINQTLLNNLILLNSLSQTLNNSNDTNHNNNNNNNSNNNSNNGNGNNGNVLNLLLGGLLNTPLLNNPLLNQLVQLSSSSNPIFNNNNNNNNNNLFTSSNILNSPISPSFQVLTENGTSIEVPLGLQQQQLQNLSVNNNNNNNNINNSLYLNGQQQQQPSLMTIPTTSTTTTTNSYQSTNDLFQDYLSNNNNNDNNNDTNNHNINRQPHDN